MHHSQKLHVELGRNSLLGEAPRFVSSTVLNILIRRVVIRSAREVRGLHIRHIHELEGLWKEVLINGGSQRTGKNKANNSRSHCNPLTKEKYYERYLRSIYFVFQKKFIFLVSTRKTVSFGLFTKLCLEGDARIYLTSTERNRWKQKNNHFARERQLLLKILTSNSLRKHTLSKPLKWSRDFYHQAQWSKL